MILDYLLHHAINTCLASRDEHSPVGDAEVERVLLQADEFLTLFKRRYGRYNFDAEMQFRQQLLQLVTLFTQRFTQNSTTPSQQSLEALRERNQARARQWIGTAARVPSAHFDTTAYDTELPLPVEDLESTRSRVLATLDIPPEDDLYDDAFYGTRASVTLLDLLPMFMTVSAQCNALYSSNMKEPLMQLAATWMLQASLEQYCVCGASGTDAIDEAFAWGYKPRSESDHRSSPGRQRADGRNTHALEAAPHHGATNRALQGAEHHRLPEAMQQINKLFENDGSEVDGWQEIRDATIEELFTAHRAGHLPAQLMRKAEIHSYGRAEEGFMEYLRALAQCIPTPVLVQLENGRIDGMSKEETEDFVKGCGLGIMELLT